VASPFSIHISALSDLLHLAPAATLITWIDSIACITMSARSADAESRDNSPEHEGSPGGKRTSKKRKVLSCYACRNRKMKCDRVYPVCGRCQKTGRADQCTYDPRLLEDVTGNNGVHMDGHTTTLTHRENATQDYAHGGPSVEALRWKTRAQETRIEELERKLAARENNSNPSHFNNGNPAEPDIKEEKMFRGKGFKTQFHGSTSVMSSIAQVRHAPAHRLTRANDGKVS